MPHAGFVRWTARWIVLLGLAELGDLVTTRADRLTGGAEANAVSVFTMDVGGPDLYWAVKLGLVAVMACLVVAALHFVRAFPGKRAAVVRALVVRSLRLCVAVLTVTDVVNLAVFLWLRRGTWPA